MRRCRAWALENDQLFFVIFLVFATPTLQLTNSLEVLDNLIHDTPYRNGKILTKCPRHEYCETTWMDAILGFCHQAGHPIDEPQVDAQPESETDDNSEEPDGESTSLAL